MQYTENLNLKKPEYSDNIDIHDINDNMDTIDGLTGGVLTFGELWDIVQENGYPIRKEHTNAFDFLFLETDESTVRFGTSAKVIEKYDPRYGIYRGDFVLPRASLEVSGSVVEHGVGRTLMTSTPILLNFTISSEAIGSYILTRFGGMYNSAVPAGEGFLLELFTSDGTDKLLFPMVGWMYDTSGPGGGNSYLCNGGYSGDVPYSVKMTFNYVTYSDLTTGVRRVDTQHAAEIMGIYDSSNVKDTWEMDDQYKTSDYIRGSLIIKA